MSDTTNLVWDNHACLPLRPHDPTFLPELERHRAAGTHVVMLNVGYGDDGIEAHVRMLAAFRGWIAAHADRFRLIESVDDISRARAAGQLAIGFDIEGANAIDDQLSLVRVYRDLGVRWLLLAYNRNNRAGGGCQDEDAGLTPFGHALLDELAEQGVVACCSHTGYRTAHEAIDASPTPVIFSHSNPRALADHPRNIPDDLIKAGAARGGVIGINGIGLFLGDNDASPARVARAAAYVADLVGAQHVGLGLDFLHDRSDLDATIAAHPEQFPPELGYSTGMDFMAPEQLPEVAHHLRARGMAESEVAGILGGNWLRIARQVWKR
ncbi:MAG: membrane dipeptidase [Betaproteobacteria bacterium]